MRETRGLRSMRVVFWKGRLLVCPELDLMASKCSIKCPSQRSVLAWSSRKSQNFGSYYWPCRVGATHMAFVQTADETASLLKLLRHRGGSVDRKLFGVVDFSSIEQIAMRRLEFSPRFGRTTLTSLGDPGL